MHAILSQDLSVTKSCFEYLDSTCNAHSFYQPTKKAVILMLIHVCFLLQGHKCFVTNGEKKNSHFFRLTHNTTL